MIEPVFGPDTSDGLAPNPVVLSYYALFFVFGAHFYQRGIKTRAGLERIASLTNRSHL